MSAADAPVSTLDTQPLQEAPSRFLLACRGLATDTTPVWLMRQAGRYLPEYQQTRARAGSFLGLCKTPELACEVTLQPITRLGVDAAILFSDILVPLEAMGIPLSFTDEGPRLEPVRSADAAAALRQPEPDEYAFVMDAVRLCRQALGAVPLIGFAGAPFTLLTYAVEGRTGSQFIETRRLIFGAPEQAHVLLNKITETVVRFLTEQVRAGAQALQLFDSWVGLLGPEDFDTFAAPYVRRILDALRPLGVPLLYFPQGGAALLDRVGALPADVFGLDWRLPIDEARRLLSSGGGLAPVVQGNLDPGVLFARPAEIERRVGQIIDRAPVLGHIFNLGHGVLQHTPVAHVQAAVEAVHRLGRARRAP